MEKQFFLSESFETNDYELFMTFDLDNKLYAAHAKSIVEVIKLPSLDMPENLPSHILGIANIRGNITTILDIRSMLGIEVKKYTVDDCVLVLSHNNITWGLIVDSVNNVINIQSNQISSTPYTINPDKILIKSIAKTEDSLLAILNLDFISSMASKSLSQLEQNIEFKYTNQPNTSISQRFSMFATDHKSLDTFNKRARDLKNELDIAAEKKKTTDRRFVTFLLNNEMYAISLQFIREFGKFGNLAIIPCVPEFYIGLSNLRGEFIPVIDIKGFLGINKTEFTDKSKIIFVKSPRMQLGILVDEVFDIINVTSEKINKSAVLHGDKTKYTSGEIILSEKMIINIFDLEKFLEDERLIIEEAV